MLNHRKNVVLAISLLAGSCFGVLPDSLTVNVGDIDSDGQDEVLVLTKRSVRSSTGYKFMTWDSVNGYVETTPPEVRTYRGYVQDDPDMRVNANIVPGNTSMNINLSDGHSLNYQLNAVPVTISGPEGTADPGTGNTVVPLVASRTAPTANHYIVPTHTMRLLDCAVTIDETYVSSLGDVERAVARVEQRYNDADFFYARDMGLAWEIGWCVVYLEANPATWYNEWFNVHRPNGAEFDIPQKFKAAGGAGASGDLFIDAMPRHTVGSISPYSRSLGHEFGHTLGAGHGSSWGDIMGGSESALGSGTVERMIGNAHVATESQSPGLVYGSPLPPFAMEDCATMLMNTTLDIDVLENDYDGNGDAISISYVDAVSAKGGSAEIVGGKVRYTPPMNWQGVDELVYHVEDATGIANRTGYVKVSVHNNGLATHILFDETSGTTAHDVGAFQAHGVLDEGMSFSSSVAGKVGRALERTAAHGKKVSADFWGTGDPLDGSMSISLWVKYQDGVPTAKGPVVCKGASVIRSRFGNPRGGWAIGHTDDGHFRFEGNLNCDSERTYSDPRFDLEATDPILSNTWQHLVMVMDRTNHLLRAWVDGAELTSSEYGTTINDGIIDNSHHPLVVFDSVTQQQQNDDTPVTVDDLRIYTKPLSDAEVADLFANPDADIQAGAPSPAHGSVGTLVTTALSWIPGKSAPAYEFDVYLGTDYTAVVNATTNSAEYKGRQSTEIFVPALGLSRTYYWRIDEVTVSGGTVPGRIWWFKTDNELPASGLELINGSFENPTLTAGGSDNDIVDWYDGDAYTYTRDDDGGAGIFPVAPDGDNWAEMDRLRWMYQQIGVYEKNKQIKVDLVLGKLSGTASHNAYVGLYSGGNPEMAADANVKRDAGHPLVDTVGAALVAQSALLPGATSEVPVEHSVILSTGTGFVEGEPLWLEIEFTAETKRKTLIDHVRVTDVSGGGGASRDGDGDGMADLWEYQHFDNGIAAQSGDNADGDAQDNLSEYIAGMNPTNAGSYFQVTNQIAVSEGFALEWPSVAGRLYTVAWTDSLTNSFQTLEENIEYPSGSHIDTNHAGEAQGFYKVDVRLK